MKSLITIGISTENAIKLKEFSTKKNWSVSATADYLIQKGLSQEKGD